MQQVQIGPQYADENRKHITHYVARIRNTRNKIEYITISREEMEIMCSLYSKHGNNLSLAAVANEFKTYTMANLRMIFNDLGIRKDTPAQAPHTQIENPDPVLDEMSINDRIFYATKRGEMLNNYYDKQALIRTTAELERLKASVFSINDSIANTCINPIRITTQSLPSPQSLNVYLADLHIGAYVPENGTYDENKNYGKEEAQRRLICVLNGIADFGHFDTINVVLLGDSIDCAGKNFRTARDHELQDENMSPSEQASAFIDILQFFISSLVENNMANKYRLFATQCGNHDGEYGKLVHRFALYATKSKCPDVETKYWDSWIGHFEQDGLHFLCTHGKDEKYMKRPLPDILNDKVYSIFNEYVIRKNYKSNIFHIVKGDLHTEAQSSSCKRFTYRNALSLYGSSEYANRNFRPNSYGVSYDIIRNGNLIRGTFQDM